MVDERHSQVFNGSSGETSLQDDIGHESTRVLKGDSASCTCYFGSSNVYVLITYCLTSQTFIVLFSIFWCIYYRCKMNSV